MADYGRVFHKEVTGSESLPPTVAVVNIGNELLAGEIRNTNGRWLGSELDRLGLRLVTIGVLPDDIERIADFLNWVRFRHDVVLCTGGLGPTPDDVTRDAVAHAFGVACVTDVELHAKLVAAGGHMARFAQPWSRRPEGSRSLRGADGGAPPFAIANVYALAGDPAEMRAAFEALSDELGRWPEARIWRRTYGVAEDRITSALDEIAVAWAAITVCSYPQHTDDGPAVEVVLRALTPSDLERAAAELESSIARLGVST